MIPVTTVFQRGKMWPLFWMVLAKNLFCLGKLNRKETSFLEISFPLLLMVMYLVEATSETTVTQQSPSQVMGLIWWGSPVSRLTACREKPAWDLCMQRDSSLSEESELCWNVDKAPQLTWRSKQGVWRMSQERFYVNLKKPWSCQAVCLSLLCKINVWVLERSLFVPFSLSLQFVALCRLVIIDKLFMLFCV